MYVEMYLCKYIYVFACIWHAYIYICVSLFIFTSKDR